MSRYFYGMCQIHVNDKWISIQERPEWFLGGQNRSFIERLFEEVPAKQVFKDYTEKSVMDLFEFMNFYFICNYRCGPMTKEEFKEDFNPICYLTLEDLLEWRKRGGIRDEETKKLDWLIGELRKIWDGKESDFRMVFTLDI